MPPPYAWNQAWLDANAQRAYPLAASATRQDVTGSFTLPDAAVVELYLAVPAALAVEPQRFYVQSLTVAGGGYAVAIGYDDGQAVPTIAAVAGFSRAAAVGGFTPFPLVGVDAFADCTGKLVVGRTRDLDDGAIGRFEFTPDAGRLDPDCIRPQLRGVSRIVVGGQVCTGDVTLEPGRNVQFRVLENAGDRVRIAIDALDATDFHEPCAGQDQLPPPIRTINGLAPDAQGDFPLRGGTCLVVEPGDHALTLRDACSQPCCGSAELDGLKLELRALGQQTVTIAGRADVIAMQQQWMTQAMTSWTKVPRPGD